MSYVTVTAGFNASGENTKLLLSTAWLFKLATHRVLSYAKSMPVLPASKIAWKNTFRRLAYEVIPNRRYADSVAVLVMGIYESCRRVGVDFREVGAGELADVSAEREGVSAEKHNPKECGRGVGNGIRLQP
ncbi:hypothetical protein [Hyperthermus butylicus]|uniref:hypothetical protein n=1 Tax=Hyperthermus butylicus TaxID=54248 RepID=UPI001E3F2B96|nr:hypothetical protein [Hyperthermus butylicus]